MALPATHLRFATAIADHLGVSAWPAYLSGTLYPDSRWVTGIDRRETHASRFRDPDFAKDAFTLGWYIHCVCDQLQGAIHGELLGDLSALTADAQWVRLSAAKVIQDMHDAAAGDPGKQVGQLTDCRTPNGEAPEKIKAYYGFVQRAYRRAVVPSWNAYAQLWSDVGLDPSVVARIDAETRRMAADKALVLNLHGVCDRMVDCFTID